MTERAYAHFIGAGGAGMSGIALVLAARGIRVTGSDLRQSRYSRALERAGVEVHIGHDAAHLGDPEIVVISTAIPERNPELAEARARGLEVWPRAKMLAHLAGERKTVAIAGTHGKTSTSSMIATMMRSMGLDPTFLIGGEVDGVNANAVNGSGDYYVVEADESDGSFLFLNPYVAIVTNMEADHLDHYASFDEIVEVFESFLARVHPDGVVVACGDDARLAEVAACCGRRVVTYGASAGCDVRFDSISPLGHGSRFTVHAGDVHVDCRVGVPGVHMVSNACAAMATAYALGLDLGDAALALSTFSGVRRRFDLIGEVAGVTVVDDYAHHPTEVAATLQAAASLGYRRVWALFQPHRYSRTAAFAGDFGESFSAADRVVLMDVYSAGEAPIPGVSGKSVLDEMLKAAPRTVAAYLPHRSDIVGYIVDRVRDGDLVLTMGAGDVTGIGPEIISELEASRRKGAAQCQ